jgi:hypothetical protein
MRNHVITRWLAAVVLLLAMCGCNRSATSPDATEPDSSASSKTARSVFAPAPPPPIVVPAGTLLTVTINQAVSTKTNTTGDAFRASLAEPVIVNGTTVAPKGTPAAGTVVQAASAGHLKRGAALALSLDALTIQGTKYTIKTSRFEESGKGRGKRTAVGAGGGAGVGAIIGAIAGGGKGAAIGAVAGGGAGTAGAAFTGERDISIPAETKISFKLRQSLTVSPN